LGHVRPVCLSGFVEGLGHAVDIAGVPLNGAGSLRSRRETTTPHAVTIEVSGATEADIERGIAAALAVFRYSGTTAHEAPSVAFLREQLHQGGYYDGEGRFSDPHGDAPLMENEVRLRDMTAREARIASLWREADYGAVAACYADREANRPHIIHYPSAIEGGFEGGIAAHCFRNQRQVCRVRPRIFR
jgi:hypothetical protein